MKTKPNGPNRSNSRNDVITLTAMLKLACREMKLRDVEMPPVLRCWWDTQCRLMKLREEEKRKLKWQEHKRTRAKVITPRLVQETIVEQGISEEELRGEGNNET